jgi:hypothetical protein
MLDDNIGNLKRPKPQPIDTSGPLRISPPANRTRTDGHGLHAIQDAVRPGRTQESGTHRTLEAQLADHNVVYPDA